MKYTEEDAETLQREMYLLWAILGGIVLMLMIFTIPLHKTLAHANKH